MNQPLMTASDRDAYYKAKKKKDQQEQRDKMKRRLDIMEQLEIKQALKEIYL